MAGTIYSTGGFRKITRLVPQVKIRFVGFILVVTAGIILLSWITPQHLEPIGPAAEGTRRG